MDDLVKQAMAKWPNVPNCYGWLGLSARGDWYLRDDAAQAAGPFAGEGASPASKGSRLEHAKLIEFIGRNYLSDENGRWFFQNGPQRVYVELEATPLIARLLPDNTVQDHRGEPLNIQRCLMDEEGHLYLDCNEGIARLHTQDVAGALPLVEMGLWVPQMLVQASLEQRFEYCKSPLNKKHQAPV